MFLPGFPMSGPRLCGNRPSCGGSGRKAAQRGINCFVKFEWRNHGRLPAFVAGIPAKQPILAFIPMSGSDFPPGETRIRMGEIHFPLGETRFPMGESHFPSGEIRFRSGEIHFPPGEIGSAPKQTHSAPRQTGSAPGQTHFAMGQIGSAPGQTHSATGEIHSDSRYFQTRCGHSGPQMNVCRSKHQMKIAGLTEADL
jgi:hypothetical protein